MSKTNKKPIVDDDFVLELAASLADSHESKSIPLLLQLERYLDTLINGAEIEKAVQTICRCRLLNMMLMELKRDFGSWEPNSWRDGEALVRAVCYVLSHSDYDNEETMVLSDAMTNMLYFCRQLQHNLELAQSPEYSGLLAPSEIARQMQLTLQSIATLCTRLPATLHAARTVVKSPWFLQLFVTNCELASVMVADWLTQLINDSRGLVAAREPNWLVIMEELIYHLSVSSSHSLAQSHIRCLATLLSAERNLVPLLHKRYRGLKLLVLRWSTTTVAGLARLLQLLDTDSFSCGTSLSSTDIWAVVKIQAWWRGTTLRRSLAHTNSAFANFQRQYRSRKQRQRQHQLLVRIGKERDFLVVRSRARLYREKLEREAELMEALSAPLVLRYLARTRHEAAVRIQAAWRGRLARKTWPDRLRTARIVVPAVLVLQRYLRSWRSRRELCRLNAETMQQVNRQRQQLQQQGGSGSLTRVRQLELAQMVDRWQTTHRGEEVAWAARPELVRETREAVTDFYRRQQEHHRQEVRMQAAVVQMDSDCRLLSNTNTSEPGQAPATEQFSCRVAPIARRAEQLHVVRMTAMARPWWRRLHVDWQDDQDEDDDDFHLGTPLVAS